MERLIRSVHSLNGSQSRGGSSGRFANSHMFARKEKAAEHGPLQDTLTVHHRPLSSGSSANPSARAGVIIAVVGGIVLFTVLLLLFLYKRRKRNKSSLGPSKLHRSNAARFGGTWLLKDGESTPKEKYTAMARPSYSVHCNVIKPKLITKPVTSAESPDVFFDIKEYEETEGEETPKRLVDSAAIFRQHWHLRAPLLGLDEAEGEVKPRRRDSLDTRKESLATSFRPRQNALQRGKRLSRSLSSLKDIELTAPLSPTLSAQDDESSKTSTLPKHSRVRKISYPLQRQAACRERKSNDLARIASLDFPKLPPTADKDLLREEAFCRNRLGSIQLSLLFTSSDSSLRLIIIRAFQLPEMSKGTLPNAFVKVVLLPDRAAKCKTRVVRRMRDPAFNEEFRFAGYTLPWLQHAKLKLQVYHHDFLSKRKLIGQLVLPLRQFRLIEETTLWRGLDAPPKRRMSTESSD